MNDFVNLGWCREGEVKDLRSAEEKDFDLMVSALEGSSGDSRTLDYIMNYRQVEGLLRGHGPLLRHTLKTKWYLSEIEDIVRHSMFLHSKIVFEVPMQRIGSHVKIGHFNDGPASYQYSFFSLDAVRNIFEKFGDAIEGKEIVLLPQLKTSSDEGLNGESLPPSTYNDFFNSVLGTWKCLSNAERLGFQDIKVSPNFDGDIGLPFFAGGDIRSLIALRRDEYESFTRWRLYLSEVMRSSSVTESEIYDSVQQGLGELDDRIRLIKRKGLLDAIGAAAVISGVGVAVKQGEMGYLSAAFGLIGGFAPALKGIVEQRDEYRRYSADPLYFGWLAQRVRT